MVELCHYVDSYYGNRYMSLGMGDGKGNKTYYFLRTVSTTMSSAMSQQLSIKLTCFFMRFVGFWVAKDSREQWFLDLALSYTIIAVIFGTCVVAMDFYYSMGDFYNFAYSLTNVTTLLMVLFKLLIFTYERKKIVQLISYSRDNFWKAEYDAIGRQVLEECEKRCILFVFTFTAFAQGTVCSYTMMPIIDNIGKNESDRSLPFNIWIDLPVTLTPYFEILFLIQTLSLYHVGILYFCFDNLLCVLNVHANGQFQILCRRMESVCDIRLKDESYGTGILTADEKYLSDPYSSSEKFKVYLRQHQSLIAFVDDVEAVFTFTILGQVLVFSGLICLVGYQAFLADGPFLRRIIFLVHCAGTFTQLFMFTLTCHNLGDGSSDLANAVYESGWYLLSGNNNNTKSLKKDMIMVITRARRPCCLTAGGFFPISLETFVKINSTAISYLTLLRQSAL